MPIPTDPVRQLLPPSPTGPANGTPSLPHSDPTGPANSAHPLPPTGATGLAARERPPPPHASTTPTDRPLPPPSQTRPTGHAHRTRRLKPSALAARARRLLPPGLTGLAALACAACCAIPLLLTAGVLSGATWAVAVSWMPGIAAVLTALAGAAWWHTTHKRHRASCAGGTCSCATP